MAEPGEDVDDGDLCDDESEPFGEARETVRDLKYPFICSRGTGTHIIDTQRRKETECEGGVEVGWVDRRKREEDRISLAIDIYIWAFCQLA